MEISLSEAATILGKSERQVRYLIKTERLPARKAANRWLIEDTDLPLSDGQRRAVAARLGTAREAFDKGLKPAAKAAKKTKEDKHYSVTDLGAFRIGFEIWRSSSSSSTRMPSWPWPSKPTSSVDSSDGGSRSSGQRRRSRHLTGICAGSSIALGAPASSRLRAEA